MKLAKVTLTVAMILLAILASGSVLARGHGGHSAGHHFSGHRHGGAHVRLGIVVGGPAFWYDPLPYYYYPPVVAIPSSPPVYIERSDEEAAPGQSQGYWYYCAEAQAYYPYVRQCAGEWQRVLPQPPPG